MKTALRFLSLFLIVSIFSSCFEIVEEVTIHKDGSGHATITLNISQSKTRLASIMLLDSINGYKVPSEATIRHHIQELTQNIKTTKGVTGVSNVINFDDYIFSIDCDFATVEALNRVVSSIGSKKEAALVAKNKPFRYSQKTQTFRRNYHYNIASEFKRIDPKDREVLNGATVTTIYRFDTPVISVKNKAAKISKSKKAVFLRVSANDLAAGRKNIKNQIQLGK